MVPAANPATHATQGDEDAAKKFQEVSKAYDTLRDLQKRQQYDNMGADGYERMAENGGVGWSPVHYAHSVTALDKDATCENLLGWARIEHALESMVTAALLLQAHSL